MTHHTSGDRSMLVVVQHMNENPPSVHGALQTLSVSSDYLDEEDDCQPDRRTHPTEKY